MSVRQVAARAGVSPATVSRVFTQPESVADETRRRVMTVAEELHYAPNQVVRPLPRRKTGHLGIVVPHLDDWFSAKITKALQEQARPVGYVLFVVSADSSPKDEERYVKTMAPHVDGMILASPSMSDEAIRQLSVETPLVVANRELTGVSTALLESGNAATDAVAHLHALGHGQIAYLRGPSGYSDNVRTHGFRAACDRLGIDGIEIGPFSQTASGGVRAADLVLATSATAALSYNDEVAVGLMSRLADRGVRVPDDFSVVGFDDTPIAGMVKPRLTTVHLPVAPLAAAVLRQLLDQIEGDDSASGGRTELSGELIVRASTGPAPRSSTEGTLDRP